MIAKLFFSRRLPAKRLALLLGLVLCSSGEGADPPRFVTGSLFSQHLNRSLLANRDYGPLHDILEHLSEERRIAIQLDRRIDPDSLVRVDVQSQFFDAGIEQLVQPVPAGVSIVAETLFVAPPEVARTLRTRIDLRERELDALLNSNLGRKFDLARRQELRWGTLTAPRELMQLVAERYKLKIENPDVIPYDQWGSGVIAHPNACEALMILATQYDLEVDWRSGTQVRLVPQTSHPMLKTEHAVRGRSSQEALALVRERFPDLDAVAKRERLIVTGLVEQQEEVSILLGNRSARRATSEVTGTLAHRRFTLRMADRPFLELVEVLEKQGVQVNRDEQQLEQAGINLKKRISLELENATAQEMFEKACSPLGLDFRIEGARIDLFPARP
jgi:hypothetical protein